MNRSALAFAAALALVAGGVPAAEPASLGAPTRIADLLQPDARDGVVTLVGEVRSRSGATFFEVADESGAMMVLIPAELRQAAGDPEVGERIRVRGVFERASLERWRWGVRAAVLERAGEAPVAMAVARATPPAASAPEATDPAAAVPAPAVAPPAPGGPDDAGALDAALAEVRDHVDAARESLRAAEVAHMRALSGRDADADVAARARAEADAQAALEAALEPAAGLLERAREAGLSRGVVALHETQIYAER